MYILQIKILPQDVDLSFLLGHIIQEAHLVIAKYGTHKIGTYFPEWSENTLGNYIGFCGNFDVLDRIIQQEYFDVMTNLNNFQSAIREIDSEQHSHVRFIRNQKLIASTPKGVQRKVKRIIKRQIARGEIGSEKEYQPRKDRPQISITETLGHVLYLESCSTQKTVPLYIQRESVRKDEDSTQKTFDNYGFSSVLEHRATVPLILPFL